ncbi:MAG: insulinase family protein [Candidatus Izimaplasma sp.]|nr:insulinase family protein [Candidatus Izimaplasma bacterium]
MIKHNHKRINETLYELTLKSGMQVFLLPKKGFHKTYVTLSSKLGSLNTNFNNTVLPKGIAHFLEHTLFSLDERNISKEFSEQNASVNAFTQHTKTTFLFSTTRQLIDNLALLLDFVFHPKFSKKTIEKEIKVITEEINMYDDNPDYDTYYALLKQLYKNHPVKDDILGTEETINTIDKNLLKTVHKAFYQPKAMVLFITGKFELDNLVSFLTNHALKSSSNPLNIADVINEPKNVIKQDGVGYGDIRIPKQTFAIKLDPSKSVMKDELILSIIFDVLLGKSSKTYNQLVEQDIINDSFYIDVSVETTFSHIILSCDTQNYQEFKTFFNTFFKQLSTHKITQEKFIKTKKQILGGFIQSLNGLEYIANQFTKYHFLNSNLFEILDVADQLTLDEINNYLTNFTKQTRYSMFTLLPEKNN